MDGSEPSVSGVATAAADIADAVNRIFRGALSARTMEELRTLTVDVARGLTGAGFGCLDEIDDDPARVGFWPAAEDHGADDAHGQGCRLIGLPTEIVKEGRSVIVNDPGVRVLRGRQPLTDQPLDNMLGVPLTIGDHVVGLLVLGNRRGGFGDAQRRIVEELAPAILQALRSKRAECVSRDSRRRLQSLLGGIPQLVWIAGDGGRWTWASPQWVDYTGLDQATSRGLGWLSALHPEDRARAVDLWSEAEAKGSLDFEGRIWHEREARYRWFRTRAQPVRDEQGAIVEWFGTCTDIDDLRLLQDRQQMLVAELQHRVRNILTIVRSVFNRTVAAGGEVEDIGDHYTGRLDALARTHVILTNSASGAVDLESLIRDELLSFGVNGEAAVTIEGPAILLQSRTAETIGLAIHELTTNAVKYGAFKARTGRLDIRWTAKLLYDGSVEVVLDWSEHGVPAVSMAPQRYGFGRELIERALPYQLGATTCLEFRGGGIRCTMTMVLPGASRPSIKEEGP